MGGVHTCSPRPWQLTAASLRSRCRRLTAFMHPQYFPNDLGLSISRTWDTLFLALLASGLRTITVNAPFLAGKAVCCRGGCVPILGEFQGSLRCLRSTKPTIINRWKGNRRRRRITRSGTSLMGIKVHPVNRYKLPLKRDSDS